ncbi:helix-turn-helix transcriptional regulator [Solimonas sp. SE-A11]|uniref:helix-turn-helix transcriptional regulator n=1 Tax=Solimonas sp. SE-A11 TaxID=3054954 RepID=UPI00259CC328|nr:helix-turn-helix transcriptional regulator [Solimonas sp. SE-A11]MDM4772554.1 helix-turn-helix transcriptional regulator [Solimonas sp. SE-A11]
MNTAILAGSSPRGSRAKVIALQRAVDIDSFWRASLSLLRSELPQRSCALFSDIEGFKPAQLRYHVVAPRKPGYVPAKSMSISAPYLARHPYIESCTYAEIAAEDPQAAQRRLEQEPDPEWSDFVVLPFWGRTEPHSVLTLFGVQRIEERERAFLDFLRPMIDAGLSRLRTLEQERNLSRLLQGYLQNSPEALVFFNRRGNMMYQSTLGESHFSRWNRALRRGQESLRLPAALGGVFGGAEDGLELQHPELPSLRATLQATEGGYVLRLTDAQTLGQVRELSPQALAALQKLTPSEQRVARLVVEGLRNDQIAERLCRSTRTIEFQLHSTFRKLGVENRVKLSRLLG